MTIPKTRTIPGSWPYHPGMLPPAKTPARRFTAVSQRERAELVKATNAQRKGLK